MRYFIYFILIFTFLGCGTSSLQERFVKAKDISVFTKGPAVIYADMQCKTLVEPFDLGGNFFSAAKLIARTEVLERIANRSFKASSISLKKYKDGLKQLNWLPLPLEEQLGEKMHQKRSDILPKKRYKRYYQKAEKVLKTVLDNIDEKYDYKFKIYVVRDMGKNAISLPGGRIYIGKKALRDEKYAKFVVAHEVSHVLKRHYTYRYQAILLDSIDNFNDLASLTRDIMKGIGENSKGVYKIIGKFDAGIKIKDIIREILRGFSKNQELEADACAVRILSPEKDFKEILVDYQKNLQESVAYKHTSLLDDILDFNTEIHPGKEERLKHINLLVKTLEEEKKSVAQQ